MTEKSHVTIQSLYVSLHVFDIFYPRYLKGIIDDSVAGVYSPGHDDSTDKRHSLLRLRNAELMLVHPQSEILPQVRPRLHCQSFK